VLGPATGAGSLQDMAGSGNLTENNGAVVQVFTSVVPSLIQSLHMLPGNNTIVAGDGNDVVFGDYGLINPMQSTGIAQIDGQLEGISATLMGLLNQFSALATVHSATAMTRSSASKANIWSKA
jgi:Ca2+-binding RTX toxin-like protein